MIPNLLHWAAAHAAQVVALGASLLLQSTIVIGAGLLAAAALRRRSGAMRSVVLRTTLAAALLCPFAACMLGRAGVSGWRINLPMLTTPSAIAMIAGIVSLLLLARLAIAIRRVRRVREQSRSASCHWIEDAGRCARVIGVATPPVLQTERFSSPCVVGWQRPAILLPADCGAARHDVLLHELAHLRRRDCRWHLLSHVARALLWFQPLMWVLSRRLAQAADEACDDFVVAYGSNRADYARALEIGHFRAFGTSRRWIRAVRTR